MDKDITSQVDFGDIDDEHLPLTKCICGRVFDSWDFVISIYRDDTQICPDCKRKMYFTNQIKVYEVEDE